MVRLNINTFDGVIVKNDENYLVKDNTKLKNLVVSSTLLHPFRKTKGQEGYQVPRIKVESPSP